MKSKELKRKEAEERQANSTFVAPDKPCQRCRFYSKPMCLQRQKCTSRKNTCEDWRAKK